MRLPQVPVPSGLVGKEGQDGALHVWWHPCAGVRLCEMMGEGPMCRGEALK